MLTLTISVGVQNRPAAAPQTGPWDKDFPVFTSPSFTSAVSALATGLLAYIATPTIFLFHAEMKNPEDFPKAVVISTGFATALYLVSGVSAVHAVRVRIPLDCSHTVHRPRRNVLLRPTRRESRTG